MSEKIVKRSKQLFKSGYGCAESVLLAVCESKDIKSALVPRIASGFCGGVANTNGMCGAVTGAIMALNIFYGRDNASESKDINYQNVQQFLKVFSAKFGSTNCSELTDCDLSTNGGRR